MATATTNVRVVTVLPIGCPICQARIAALTATDDQSLFRCGQCETMILVPKIAWERTTPLNQKAV